MTLTRTAFAFWVTILLVVGLLPSVWSQPAFGAEDTEEIGPTSADRVEEIEQEQADEAATAEEDLSSFLTLFNGEAETAEEQGLLQSDLNQVNPYQLPDSSFLYDTTIGELASADSYLNGQTVQVIGEVVGDRIRGSFDDSAYWITLQDRSDTLAVVAVYMNAADTGVIDTYGMYGTRGSLIQVQGIFYLVCPEHQGVSDLHAQSVALVERGTELAEPFHWGMFVAGSALLVVAAIFFFLYRSIQEKQR